MTFNRNDRNVFGYKLYIVKSDSMAATDFAAGALIFVKEVDPSTLEEGDIITFMSQDTGSFGETITHKIRKLTTGKDGSPGFITYGTTTNTDDDTVVTYPYILGQYQGQIPGVGTFFSFLKSTTGYVVCIFLPFMLIILLEAWRFVKLLGKYKKEQTDTLQAEKDKIEEENAKMQAELNALRAQLEQKNAAPEEPETAAEETQQEQ